MEKKASILSLDVQNLSLEQRLAHVKKLPPEDAWAQGLLLGDEWANSLTHGLGLFLSLIGIIFLFIIPFQQQDYWKLFNLGVYGGSLVLLYTASTFYHAVRRPLLKRIFRTVDHCAIYLLIAGTYTPFTMLLLKGFWGWTLFSIIWTLAFVGISLKIFFRHRFPILSTTIYLFMGWLIVIAAEPLINQLHFQGLCWLLAGGLCYTVGVIFYVLDKRCFYHAIWHVFVLGGSVCHYLAVLFYL